MTLFIFALCIKIMIESRGARMPINFYAMNWKMYFMEISGGNYSCWCDIKIFMPMPDGYHYLLAQTNVFNLVTV